MNVDFVPSREHVPNWFATDRPETPVDVVLLLFHLPRWPPKITRIFHAGYNTAGYTGRQLVQDNLNVSENKNVLRSTQVIVIGAQPAQGKHCSFANI
jgi:hypothetical protein